MKETYCKIILNEESYKAFVYAVKNQYWYQMYIDDLPIWGLYNVLMDNIYICYLENNKK